MSNDVQENFLSLVRQRRSCRAYNPQRQVPRTALNACLEAARLAPSACNRQPWRFILVDDASQRRALFDTARRRGIAHAWLQDVPVIVAVCVRRDMITHRLAPAISGIPYYLLDAAIAGEHFVLAATASGLGTCWIGWFRERAVKRILKIPRSVRVISLIAVGWPASETEDIRTAAPLPRRAIEDISAWNGWDNRL